MYYRLLEKTESKGRALQMYRFSRNLTRKELAAQLGIDPSCISRYENDKFKKGSKTEKFMDDLFEPFISQLAVYKKKEEKEEEK